MINCDLMPVPRLSLADVESHLMRSTVHVDEMFMVRVSYKVITMDRHSCNGCEHVMIWSYSAAAYQDIWYLRLRRGVLAGKVGIWDTAPPGGEKGITPAFFPQEERKARWRTS